MSNIIYIGIDPSFSGTGLYCSNEKFKLVTTTKEKTVEKIHDIFGQIFEFICEQGEINNIVIGIEGFSFMSKGRSISQLFGLGWYIRTMLYSFNIPFYEIPPHSWKKFLLRTKLNKESKDLLILETYKRYKIEIRNNNLCDAFNIMQLTEHLDYVKNVNTSQQQYTNLEWEIIKKLLK
jgi:crossover junction endodeoxyribonuclease RuvC